jgi:hypothetical protein
MKKKKKKPKKLTKLEKYLSTKISTNRKDTAGVAALTIGDLLYDMARVDPLYIRGAQFARPKSDIDSVFKIGKQNLKDISERGQDYFDRLHNINYTGNVHEFVTDQWMLENHKFLTDQWMMKNDVEIVIPSKMNQAGWDRIYNGQKWQIKFGSVENVREARLKNPEMPVATDLETAQEYKQKFPDDTGVVLGTTPRSLTENIVSEGGKASMEVHQNEELFETGIPEFVGIASVVSVFRNISYLLDKKTDLSTGLQNVALDTAGKATIMWGGAKIGGLIGGPLLAAVGAVGALFLSIDWISNLKIDWFCEKERDQLKKDLDNYIKKSGILLTRNLKTFRKKINKIESYSEDKIINKVLRIFNKVFRKETKKKKTIPKELCEYLTTRMNGEYKIKNHILNILTRANSEEEEKDEKGSKYRWLDTKFENLSNTKLPEVVQVAIRTASEVGIHPEFIQKEYKKLIDSLKAFIMATQKRGI